VLGPLVALRAALVSQIEARRSDALVALRAAFVSTSVVVLKE
jgi:hypothetical protein